MRFHIHPTKGARRFLVGLSILIGVAAFFSQCSIPCRQPDLIALDAPMSLTSGSRSYRFLAHESATHILAVTINETVGGLNTACLFGAVDFTQPDTLPACKNDVMKFNWKISKGVKTIASGTFPRPDRRGPGALYESGIAEYIVSGEFHLHRNTDYILIVNNTSDISNFDSADPHVTITNNRQYMRTEDVWDLQQIITFGMESVGLGWGAIVVIILIRRSQRGSE